jgi:hypothetical protein
MPRSMKGTARKRKPARKQTKTAKALKPQAKKSEKAAGRSRAEGIRLFQVAGRPSQHFIKVLGENGPKMTWEQRAKAGVPAEKFQAALAAAKQSGR